MRVFRAAAIIALLAGPAYAQSSGEHVQRYGETSKPKSPQEIESEKQADKAYNNSLGNIPDKAPTDPWGNARSADTPKQSTKAAGKAAPAKPRTSTGTGTSTGTAAN
jgi:hypothetical protein